MSSDEAAGCEAAKYLECFDTVNLVHSSTVMYSTWTGVPSMSSVMFE